MNGWEVRKEQGGRAFREQIVGLVMARKEHSENYFTAIRNRLPRLYDLWRGITTGRWSPHKTNVHIPYIYSTIQADAARKMATSFGQYPVVNFLGYGPDDAPSARKQEAVINAQFKDAEAFEKEYTNIISADLYGVGITQLMWDHREEDRVVTDFATMPLSGKVVRQIQKKRILVFDGPNWENVDRLDFFPQPGIARLRKMRWMIRRYYLDLDEVRYMASELGGKVFSASEVARMEMDGSGAQMAYDTAQARRFELYAGQDPLMARFQERYSRPVEILEMWGHVPSELAPDGDPLRVITVANGSYLLRNKANPFQHRLNPFFATSFNPDPHYFDAAGKAEIAEKLQIAGNRFLNQQLDALDLVIDPMWLYDRHKGINTRKLYARTGGLIAVDGNPGDAMTPISPDLRGFQVASQKGMEMDGMIQRGTGMVDDAVMGMGGGDRQTAREFVGRREAAGTRLLLESRMYEEMYLEPLANAMCSLNRQFLEPPIEALILGDSAQVDPNTGRPIPSTRETITGKDLVRYYSARAMGASMAISRGQRKQEAVQLLQMVQQTPQVIGSVNLINFMRQIFRIFEWNNVNELIANQPALQDTLNGVGAGGGPEGVGRIPEEEAMGLPAGIQAMQQMAGA